MKTRRRKGYIAAAVGFATAGDNDATRAIHHEVAKEVEAIVREGQPLDDTQAKARVHTRLKIMRATGRHRRATAGAEAVAKDEEGMQTIRAGVQARERQQRGRAKGALVNSANAAARHAEWQALFDEIRRKHPDKNTWSQHRIQRMVADRSNASVHTVRKVARDR